MANTDFPQWLEDELSRRGMRPTDLAKKAGLDNGILSRILNRERKPSAETLIAIARGFKMPHDQVLRAAGVLPVSDAPHRPMVDRVSHLLDQLDDDDLEEEERLLRAKIDLKEERERKNAAKKRRPATTG